MYAARTTISPASAVGAVERGEMLPRADIAAGDVLIGLASSGVHSNGYSLVRRLVARGELGWDAPAPFAAATLARPRRCWRRRASTSSRCSRPCASTARHQGLAHITGGGLSENLPRVLPDGLAAHIDLARVAGARRVRLAAAARAASTTRRCCARSTAASAWLPWWRSRDRQRGAGRARRRRAKPRPCIGEIEPGRGVKSPAKGKGEAEAVRYSGRLASADRLMTKARRHPDLGARLQHDGAGRAARAPTILPRSSLVISNRPTRPGLPGQGCGTAGHRHRPQGLRLAARPSMGRRSALPTRRRRDGRARGFHAHPKPAVRAQMARPAAQHPPLAAARVQRPASACAGARGGRQNLRLHGAFRHRGDGRRTNHRPGRGARAATAIRPKRWRTAFWSPSTGFIPRPCALVAAGRPRARVRPRTILVAAASLGRVVSQPWR